MRENRLRLDGYIQSWLVNSIVKRMKFIKIEDIRGER